MFTVQLAEINICIDNKYEYIEDMCRDYLTHQAPEVTVSVTEQEILEEDGGGKFSSGYLESLAI